MNKKQILLSYFDKSKKLTITNPLYRKQVEALCSFFLLSDEIKHDLSTQLISKILKDSSRHLEHSESSHSVKEFEISHPPADGFEMTKCATSIIAKQDGIVAGIEESVYILTKQSGIKVREKVKDGVSVKKGEVILELTGNFDQLLKLERTVLNILQRMSGIATETHRLISLLNSTTKIAATRKTLWGWLDKKAVALGGGLTHRLSLKDGILIKDNHLDLISTNKLVAIEKIIEQIKEKRINGLCEIEVNTYQQAIFAKKWWHEVMRDIPLIIMLDNFSAKEAKKTIMAIKSSNLIIELSGGINERNIQEYASIGADVFSLGCLTHSSKSLDLSLTIK